MTRLSVNINKFATLRNARGGNNPNLISIVKDCERFGAQGITVHPRPDERHITYNDVKTLQEIVTTEFNIEGYPSRDFLDLVKSAHPAQVTLVPDSPEVLTSNAGWDTIRDGSFLSETLTYFKNLGIRTSLFVDPDKAMIESAAQLGADRIELYTEGFAVKFRKNPSQAVQRYHDGAILAHELGLKINAGHDLDLTNLSFFNKNVPHLEEVSIGHALVCDALYFGLENTIQLYLRKLNE